MNIEEAKIKLQNINAGILYFAKDEEYEEYAEAINVILSELDKRDKELEETKKKIPSIANGTYTGDFEGLLKTEKEIIKRDKVINEMAKEIADITGSCPYDKYDYGVDCSLRCEEGIEAECWVEYFTNKVEREGK